MRMLQEDKARGAGLDSSSTKRRSIPKLARLARESKVVILPHMGSATMGRPHRHGREGDHTNIRTFCDGPPSAPDRYLPLPGLIRPTFPPPTTVQRGPHTP